MIDPQWFMQAMQGDNIIVRLHLGTGRDTPRQVRALAYTYWVDDMAYNGAEVRYESDASAEKFPPLTLVPLPGPPDNWKPFILEQSRTWPTLWHQSIMVICTRGPFVNQLVAPSRPEVLHHLARFEGLALEAERHAGVFDRITYQIVAKRLGGIVRGCAASWTKLLDAS